MYAQLPSSAVRPPLARLGRPRRAMASQPLAAAVAAVPGLRTYSLDKLSASEQKALMARPRVDFTSIVDTVRCPLSAVPRPRNSQCASGAAHRGGCARARRRGCGRVHGAL